MKKIISALVIVLFVFSLASCSFSQRYSAASMKSGLEKGGYTVVENPRIDNFDTSKLEGLQTILYGYKTVDGKERGILLMVFDNYDNAGEVLNGTYGADGTTTASERVGILADWGKAHSANEEGEAYIGTSNNVVWTGDKDARLSAGIKLLTDK